MKRIFPFLALAVVLAGCSNKITTVEHEGFNVVEQTKGPSLGYSPESGVGILTIDGYAFKDLNQNGELDVYEDWRQDPKTRAADLASKMSIEQIAGLMLYSDHQSVPSAELTEVQKKFLRDDNLRAILFTTVKDAKTAAQWSNNVQAFVEGIGLGIPANNSSDPRHQASSNMEFESGGGAISRWPSPLGMAATFSPEVMETFAHIASLEYRALGIATALSPQVDLATEPRWWRYSGTFGESAHLAADLARAYCDGFQTSPKEKAIDGAWGYESVNAMVKHWYGYGAQEAGRDSHFATGEYAVYPGNQLELQKIPFTEGAFKLNGGTEMASAVMPIYSILWNQDPSGANVGGSYSDFVINQELRQKENFDGVICTDWHITYDTGALNNDGRGKPWGVEDLTVSERHYKILKAGVDQFGGNNDSGPVIDAYNMWKEDYGEEAARSRFEDSARRLLLNIFRTGLFENPYLDPEESDEIVGNPEFMQAGYDAQIKSVIMLKNKANVLPAKKTKVYMPVRHNTPEFQVWAPATPESWGYAIDTNLVKKYFDFVTDPEEADFAIVSIKEPGLNLGYSYEDAAKGGNGYIPVSLQYEDYTAVDAREVSIAGGNPLENFTNRSYKGKTIKTSNRDDMVMVQKTKELMGDKPVVVIVNIGKPVILSEIEPYADAVLISFGVQNQVLLDIISGKAEPSGLLPMQLPANMSTVEKQFEDVAFDMDCYVDSEGNEYNFAFGMDWSGVINDLRTEKYRVTCPTAEYTTPSGKTLSVSMINHGSVAFSYDGYNIQVDPVAKTGGRTINYAAFPKSDCILVSHEHGDHLDPDTINLLKKDGTRILLNEKSQQKLSEGEIVKNGDSVKIGTIGLDIVPAYNSTPGHENFHPKGNGNGFIFDFDGFKVYVSGDTEDIPEMDNIKDIDLAFLSANLPFTMTVDQCISAAKRISPKILIPYHLSQTDMQAIADGLKGTGIVVKLYPTLR